MAWVVKRTKLDLKKLFFGTPYCKVCKIVPNTTSAKAKFWQTHSLLGHFFHIDNRTTVLSILIFSCLKVVCFLALAIKTFERGVHPHLD